MLVMRNTPSGMIWQAYRVANEQEETILTKNAKSNGFIVQCEPPDYTKETTPNWRETSEWKECVTGKLSDRAKGQEAVREILKGIRRDGPYWLDGYKDWLVSCFSLRDPKDLNGFTPIACWSELDTVCKQWMVCVKDGEFYVDRLFGSDFGRGYGLKPKLAESQLYPPHVFDWLFKDVIPNYKKS